MFDTVFYYIGWAFIAALSKLMIQKNLVAYAPVPKGPKILVANHPTVSDPFILFGTMRNRMSILVLDKVFCIPLFGRYLKLIGHIPVVQGDGQEAFKRALDFLNKGISVLVFIEGDISPDNGYAKPKTGAVRLACNSGAPIVPIGLGIQKEKITRINATIGGTKVLESWYFHGKYEITIGKHFYVKGDLKDKPKVREMTDKVMAKVINLAKESSSRIQA